LEDLGATYDDHLKLIVNRVVDFLLVLTVLFLLGVTAEQLRANIAVKTGTVQRNNGISNWKLWTAIYICTF